MNENEHNLFKKMVKYGKNLRLGFAQRRVFLREDHSSPLFTMSLGLAVAVRKIFREKAQIRLSREPIIEKKPITHFMRRMRVDPMEKFNAPTVVSFIHFYKNQKDMELRKPAGVLFSYIELAQLSHLLKLLEYPEIDEDDEEQVEDACGAVCNIIAGYFKTELVALGYPQLEMSVFNSYINSVVDGVDYPQKATYKYEIGYEVAGHKKLVTEMVMAPLTRMPK
ncbi:MAG: hypothetical protein JNN05_04240 [Candidatus Omnitrophica bacterium]|nr:hypothetical protein [Candidatus Omnitrophota bacterium]